LALVIWCRPSSFRGVAFLNCGNSVEVVQSYMRGPFILCFESFVSVFVFLRRLLSVISIILPLPFFVAPEESFYQISLNTTSQQLSPPPQSFFFPRSRHTLSGDLTGTPLFLFCNFPLFAGSTQAQLPSTKKTRLY